MKKIWLRCKKCGITDNSSAILGHVGTSKNMKCPDCADSTGFATMCRNCCPTQHGTKFGDWKNE